jgi:serine protease
MSKNVLRDSLRGSGLFFLAGSLLVGLSVSSAGCAADGSDPESFEAIAENNMTFEEFKELVYKEPWENGVWIVNGDEPIEDERALKEFFNELAQQGSLIVHRPNGVVAKWSDTQKMNLTYCVSTNFGGNYSTVVSAMNNATAAWENAAPLNFIHSSSHDSNCTASNTSVVFDVRPVSGQPYIARAFFPNQSRSSRNVLIDSSAFGNLSPWTLTGVLRHELGHTLGFRHEHTRPEAGTCYEDNQWQALTTYDSASVMHYPHCNGTQTGDLVLTQKDKDGANALY